MVTQENFKSKLLTDVSSYLNEAAIKFLDVENRDQAIRQLTENLCASYSLDWLQEDFLKAVLEREKIASTGIGMGVALPHAKLPAFDDFFISVGILKKGINWNSMDKLDVRLIFLIGGPDDKQCDYLNILSQLTLVLRDEEVRKNLLSFSRPRQIIDTFRLAQEEN